MSEVFPQDVAFRLLSNVYRRTLLDCLDRHGPSLALADAAEEVARRTRGEPVADVSADAIERIHRSLYHSHVPQLAAEDVVTYQRERDLVTLTVRGERLVAVRRRLASVDGIEATDVED